MLKPFDSDLQIELERARKDAEYENAIFDEKEKWRNTEGEPPRPSKHRNQQMHNAAKARKKRKQQRASRRRNRRR